MLLIAIANTPWYLWGRQLRPSTIHPPGGSPLDQAVQVTSIITIDFRVYRCSPSCSATAWCSS